MGTSYSWVPGFFGSFFIFQAHTTCFYFSLHRSAVVFKHENYKESKTSPEKEEKDASAVIHVIVLSICYQFSFFLFYFPFLLPNFLFVNCENSRL